MVFYGGSVARDGPELGRIVRLIVWEILWNTVGFMGYLYMDFLFNRWWERMWNFLVDNVMFNRDQSQFSCGHICLYMGILWQELGWKFWQESAIK